MAAREQSEMVRAASEGHAASVRKFFPSSGERERLSALRAACTNDHVDTVRALAEMGSFTQDNWRSVYGSCAFSSACQDVCSGKLWPTWIRIFFWTNEDDYSHGLARRPKFYSGMCFS